MVREHTFLVELASIPLIGTYSLETVRTIMIIPRLSHFPPFSLRLSLDAIHRVRNLIKLKEKKVFIPISKISTLTEIEEMTIFAAR